MPSLRRRRGRHERVVRRRWPAAAALALVVLGSAGSVVLADRASSPTAPGLATQRAALTAGRAPVSAAPTATSPTMSPPAATSPTAASPTVPAPTASSPTAPPPTANLATTAPATRVETVQLRWDGLDRSAVVVHPAGQQGPLPLLLVLHGRASSPSGERARTHLDDLAARGAAVVAFPRAAGPTWHAGPGCCDGAAADDVGFLAALAARLVADGSADPTRVSAGGFSVGAMMAYRLACERPGLLAAVASVGGVLVAPCPEQLRVPLLEVHARGDGSVPLVGTPRSPLLGIALPSVGDGVELWRRRDGCTGRLYAAAVRTVGLAEVRDVAGCPPGAAVRLVLTSTVGHHWLLASEGFDTSGAVWDFVAAQHR